MEEKQSFEDKPIFRLFNVVLFILYAGVFLISIIAAILGYSEREIKSASVTCKDGTSWDALKPKDITYDSYALCGICTKRSLGGDAYTDCTYQDMDYSSYDVERTKEPWSWNTIIYPLITISLGLGFVDFLRLTIFYIFSGRVAFEKSLLLKLIRLFTTP